jgi:flavin reductase (DIM6/NTAB) family NADH-FMN oxidoreductase RutF
MDLKNYFPNTDKVIDALNNSGAFLVVKDRSDRINVMTFAWGLFGIFWKDPVFMVAVRPSRYTFGLIENADDFTVTVPFSGMHKELIYCGTHSGREFNKFKEANLTIRSAKSVKSPIIEAKNSCNYECKIVQASALDKMRLNQKYDEELYQDKSYHTYYFGKIIECYEN